jgi:hypothetical protein
VSGCSSNIVLRTVAPVPNLGNDGNHLVGVDLAFAFYLISWGLLSSVYLGDLARI